MAVMYIHAQISLPSCLNIYSAITITVMSQWEIPPLQIQTTLSNGLSVMQLKSSVANLPWPAKFNLK